MSAVLLGYIPYVRGHRDEGFQSTRTEVHSPNVVSGGFGNKKVALRVRRYNQVSCQRRLRCNGFLYPGSVGAVSGYCVDDAAHGIYAPDP